MKFARQQRVDTCNYRFYSNETQREFRRMRLNAFNDWENEKRVIFNGFIDNSSTWYLIDDRQKVEKRFLKKGNYDITITEYSYERFLLSQSRNFFSEDEKGKNLRENKN